MKKENIYKFLYGVGILLIIGFVIRLGADYFKYDPINNSSPFYINIVVRSVEFLLPSIILITISIILLKKQK